jgi:hypothetical protein
LDGPVVGRKKGINDGMGIMDEEYWEVSLSMEATMGEGKLGYRTGKKNFQIAIEILLQ